MPAPPSIQALLDRYEVHRMAYLRDEANYNEAKVRKDFVEPFFRALNWDIDNNKGFSEAYREVMLEEPIRIRERTQFFDYTFRIGGIRKFILEAKKPAVSIRDNSDAALQLRWYAWNAKLPLSILTNFEEFAVYDCTRKPATNEAASVARIEYFTYKDFPAKWEWIASVFSQDSILKGSFDRYAAETKGKKGTASVDDDILAEIESWRDTLARNLAIRTSFNVDEINAVVQRTIDRILFLRICEDRGIEEYGALQKLTAGDNVYPRLCEIFRHADEKYNSGLFHFQEEAEISEPPDTISFGAKIDDKVLKGIIKRLYYPESPYLFSVIQPAILGHVYEQFLGKVIRLTEGRQAKVEYKPEVKKAGGVFYTPQYIVEYIVKHTVGELVKDKTPREIAKLRILDPACGSGSFLIGAFQFLLDWHRDWYIEKLVPVYIDKKESILDPAVLALLPEPTPRGKKKLAQIELPIYRAGTSGDATRTRSDWRLTTAEKKRILLNNIFGVDIDQQAVEVTKLSLLLKVLEEENEENIEKQLKLFEERALPSLHQNIKCGNSLIGWDIVTPEMPSDEVKRINPFDWSKEFASVMAAGGFDAVIGNPPYIRIQTMKEWAPTEVEVYKKKFLSASKGNYDIYVVFVEKGLALLNKNGLLGYILPHKFFNAQYGEPLRSVISKGKHLKEIVNFGHQQVFENATTYTCLLFLGKSERKEIFIINIDNLLTWRNNTSTIVMGKILSGSVQSTEWNFVVGQNSNLFEKMQNIPTKLENVTDRIFQGIKTGSDKIFIVNELSREEKRVKIRSPEKNTEYWLEPDLLHSLVKGGDSKRYSLTTTNRLILFPYSANEKGLMNLIPESILKEKYPLTFGYLQENKKVLENRENGKMKGSQWFSYSRNQALDTISLPKIFTPDLVSHVSFSLDNIGNLFFTGGAAGGYGVLVATNYSREYILGILNSNLINWYLRQISTTFRGGWFSCESRFIRHIPIRTINVADHLDKTRHDRMVVLVTLMLDLNKKLQEARLEQERTMLSRQIEATNSAIDKLVYELYALTEEEIAIVEGKKG